MNFAARSRNRNFVRDFHRKQVPRRMLIMAHPAVMLNVFMDLMRTLSVTACARQHHCSKTLYGHGQRDEQNKKSTKGAHVRKII